MKLPPASAHGQPRLGAGALGIRKAVSTRLSCTTSLLVPVATNLSQGPGLLRAGPPTAATSTRAPTRPMHCNLSLPSAFNLTSMLARLIPAPGSPDCDDEGRTSPAGLDVT